jgi:SAM-dependent methyltransferase
MIRVAQERIGSRVCVGDVELLPFADGSIDSAYLVWVLHLVHDPIATLREAARVVRAGGRVATIASSSIYDDGDEIAPIVDRLAPLRQARLDHNALVVSDHPGLQLVHEGFTAWDEHETVPSAEADAIEQRIYSSLFDVDDATWERVVVPVIDALRALPDPDRPRRRRNRHPIVVWAVAAVV